MLGLLRPLLMEFPDSCLGRYLFNTNENGYFFLLEMNQNVENNVVFYFKNSPVDESVAMDMFGSRVLATWSRHFGRKRSGVKQ